MAEKTSSQSAQALFQSLSAGPESKPLKGILRDARSLNQFELQEFRIEGRTQPESPAEKMHRQINQLQHELDLAKNKNKVLEAEHEKRLQASKAQALAEGEAKGLEKGYIKAKTEFEAKLKAFQNEVGVALKSMNDAYGKRCTELEDQSIELALGLAKRLYCAESSENTTIIASIIREAMSHLGQEESLLILLNPKDQAQAEQSSSFWSPLGSAVREIRIETDARISRGGCIIESGRGARIELTSEQILQKIDTAVRERYAQLKSSQP